MPPKDRKDWFQSENERLKFEEAEGQLCATHDVARQMSIMAKAMIQVLDTLPDILERDCGLQPREVSKVQSTIDDLRDQLAARLMDNSD
ncbi:phage protein [Vibrio astriarenae]|nr:phage protein [Vibrio sp. C7]